MHFHGENTRKIKSGQCKEDAKKIFRKWDESLSGHNPLYSKNVRINGKKVDSKGKVIK